MQEKQAAMAALAMMEPQVEMEFYQTLQVHGMQAEVEEARPGTLLVRQEALAVKVVAATGRTMMARQRMAMKTPAAGAAEVVPEVAALGAMAAPASWLCAMS